MSRILGKVATAVAALSLASVPAVAAQAPASKLSLRASTTADKAENLSPTPIIAAVALIAFSAGVIIVATNDDNDDPDSP
ncbi:MAG TPA: hypothetical protein VM662_11055 [Sphingomonas sp.]|nr:hypothetical protein [Sphingomonas sp.]